MPRLEDHCWSCSCSSKADTKHSSGASWVASKVEEMMSIITTVLGSAYGSLHDVRTTNLIRRGLVLFTVGVFLALVLNLLQIQRNVTLFPEEVMTTLFSSAWWIPPCCGTGAGEFVGGCLICFLIRIVLLFGDKGGQIGEGSQCSRFFLIKYYFW